MNIVQQTRFFTQNYPQLQGLRTFPVGLLLLVITLWANIQHGPARDFTVPILAALVCLALYIVIDRYYNRVYGKVKRAVPHSELVWMAIYAVLALGAFIIDTSNLISISLLGLVFAFAFISASVWYWRPATILFSINVILAVLLALLSFLPLVTQLEWWRFFGFRSLLLTFTFLYSFLFMADGIIVHVYFIRSLPVIQEAS
jgi:hypothetical protein